MISVRLLNSVYHFTINRYIPILDQTNTTEPIQGRTGLSDRESEKEAASFLVLCSLNNPSRRASLPASLRLRGARCQRQATGPHVPISQWGDVGVKLIKLALCCRAWRFLDSLGSNQSLRLRPLPMKKSRVPATASAAGFLPLNIS